MITGIEVFSSGKDFSGWELFRYFSKIESGWIWEEYPTLIFNWYFNKIVIREKTDPLKYQNLLYEGENMNKGDLIQGFYFLVI